MYHVSPIVVIVYLLQIDSMNLRSLVYLSGLYALILIKQDTIINLKFYDNVRKDRHFFSLLFNFSCIIYHPFACIVSV